MTTSQRWFVIVCCAVLILFFYLLKPILAPFLIGALCAYLGDPFADRLEDRGLGRTTAVCIVFLIMTSLLTLVLVLLIPLLGRQIDAMITRLPQTIGWAQTIALPWLSDKLNLPPLDIPFDDIRALIANNWQRAGNIATVLMRSVTSSSLVFLGWVANILLIPVVAFYLLRDWDVLMARIRDILPRHIEPTVSRLAGECDSVLSAFLRGQMLVMFLLGILYAIGLSLIGIDVAILLAIVAGVASVVPYLGIIVGVVSSGIAALVQFGDVWHLLAVLAVFGIGQLLEGMFLTPLLVGDRIGLHPVAVIFAVLAGGQLAGFVGVLVALPVAAVVMVVLRHMHGHYKLSEFYGTEDTQEQQAAAQENAD